MNKEECINAVAAKTSPSKVEINKGSNPGTGEPIDIPARKVVRFKPGAVLSGAIKQEA
ncbi:MAG: HU family DNA-binding protein [Tannerellaceae bacterium]|jgi:nucleoid DNA-binding protein|nr:HU family DNA-binding protein [Tannerellaceae bacterium]